MGKPLKMETHTLASKTLIMALGVRCVSKSEVAIRAATTNATVVKKPKTF